MWCESRSYRYMVYDHKSLPKVMITGSFSEIPVAIGAKSKTSLDYFIGVCLVETLNVGNALTVLHVSQLKLYKTWYINNTIDYTYIFYNPNDRFTEVITSMPLLVIIMLLSTRIPPIYWYCLTLLKLTYFFIFSFLIKTCIRSLLK